MYQKIIKERDEEIIFLKNQNQLQNKINNDLKNQANIIAQKNAYQKSLLFQYKIGRISIDSSLLKNNSKSFQSLDLEMEYSLSFNKLQTPIKEFKKASKIPNTKNSVHEIQSKNINSNSFISKEKINCTEEINQIQKIDNSSFFIKIHIFKAISQRE